MMKRIFYSLLPACIFFMSGCHSKKYIQTENNGIDPAVKKEISLVNEQVIQAIQHKDVAALDGMSIQDLTTDPPRFDRVVNSPGIENISPGSCEIFFEAYTINPRREPVNKIRVPGVEGKTYVLEYKATHEEMYAVLLKPENKERNQVEYMLTIMYAREKGAWKIAGLTFHPYSFYGKTAPMLMEVSQSYESWSSTNAYLWAVLMDTCMSPSGNYGHYENEGDMEVFKRGVYKAFSVSYIFPWTVNDIPTKPRIIRIYPEMHPESLCPVIEYVTSIPLKDTAALYHENNMLREQAKDIFYGLYAGKPAVYYVACNKMPGGGAATESYRFEDKTGSDKKDRD